MLAHIKFSFVVVAGAGLINALSLSQPCQNSLKQLLTSSDAACLNPASFLPLMIGASQSVPDTINNWINGICTTGSCTNETLASVITNVTSGCSSDLAPLGVTQDTIQEVISIVQQAYPTVRQAGCLKDDSTNTLCVSETINNVQNAVGELQINDLSFLNIIADVQRLIQTGVQTLACTSCIKATYTTVRSAFPDLVSPLTQDVQELCGAAFVDGNTPEGISQSAVSGVFTEQGTSNSAALSLNPWSSVAGFALLTISSVFLTL